MKKTNHKSIRKALVKPAAFTASLLMATCLAEAVPVLGASATPAEGQYGEQADIAGLTGTITAKGITDNNVTVKAYQIVDGYYRDGKLVKYVLMDRVNGAIAGIEDETKGQIQGTNDIITADEITTIANNIGNGLFTADNGITMTKEADGSFRANVEPGMYIILVSGGDGTVYNPAVCSVNLNDANAVSGSIEAGSVDLGDYFRYSDNVNGSIAYVKSSTSTLDKKIEKSQKSIFTAQEDFENQDGNTFAVKAGKGDTAAFGDLITFKLDSMTIPSFSKHYTHPQYIITDTLQRGSFSNLTRNSFTSILVDGEQVTIKSTSECESEDIDTSLASYELDAEKSQESWLILQGKVIAKINIEDNSFRVAFCEGYLRSVAGNEIRPSLEITYEVTLLESAGVNFSENVNTVKLEYSNDPANEDSFKEITKHTYHYSFGIDADIDAQDSAGNEETHEFSKVTEGLAENERDYSMQGVSTGNAGGTAGAKTYVSASPLEGAEFKLYSDEACTKPVMKRIVNADGTVSAGSEEYKVKSDSNGHFSFKGLDEGTYYIKETDAPSGYSISDALYKMVISAEINEDGTLKSYEVKTSYKSSAAGINEWTLAGDARYSSEALIDERGAVSNTITSEVIPVEIVDVKLQTLVSTGGKGVMTIMVTALAIGVGAGLMTFIGKRREKMQDNR